VSLWKTKNWFPTGLTGTTTIYFPYKQHTRGLGGFGFPVFEQDGNFSKTHFVIQKIFGMQPFALTKPVFAHVKLFTHAICGLEFREDQF